MPRDLGELFQFICSQMNVKGRRLEEIQSIAPVFFLVWDLLQTVAGKGAWCVAVLGQ